MPNDSVRKLYALLNSNRQWYYQHRRPSVQEDHDRSLCQARHPLRKDVAGYGYRRMTKARKPAGLEDQSQASRARDAASGSDLSAQTAVCAYHGLQAWRAGLSAFEQSVGIQISMSVPGQPTQNARAESCFKTLKGEEVYVHRYQTFEEAQAHLQTFLGEVYNAKRLHSSLDYVPP